MADRKARLAALAAKAGRSKRAENKSGEKQGVEDENPPQDKSLVAQKETEEEMNEPEPKRAKTEERSLLEQAVEEAQKEVAIVAAADGDVMKMGPKKMNADLKRDIQEKMDKLERRTQRAIVSLLKERLEQEASQDVPDLD